LTANGLRCLLGRVYKLELFDGKQAYSTLRGLNADEIFDLYVFSRKFDFDRLTGAVWYSLGSYLPRLRPPISGSKEIKSIERWVAVACDEDDETLMERILSVLERSKSLEAFGIWRLVEMAKPEWRLEVLRALLQGGDSVESKETESAEPKWTTRRLQMVDKHTDIKFRPNTRKRKSLSGIAPRAPVYCAEFTPRPSYRRRKRGTPPDWLIVPFISGHTTMHRQTTGTWGIFAYSTAKSREGGLSRMHLLSTSGCAR
jgi:hypothetical protein